MRYSLNVTYVCNWYCTYCIIDTHNQPKRTQRNVLDDIKTIPVGSKVTLSSGEPGLLTEKEIRLVIWLLKNKGCSIDLLTNGLFLSKYLDNTIMDDIDTIHYHCVENLTDDIEFTELESPKYDYQIIVNNYNYDYLIEFLNRYPDIKFSIVPSKNVEVLDKKKAFSILKNLRHHMTQRSIKEFFECACDDVKYLD